jgi:hypothetical protein
MRAAGYQHLPACGDRWVKADWSLKLLRGSSFRRSVVGCLKPDIVVDLRWLE